ncbi:MAG TPA: ubiquitin-like domain-containing protein [candidate division Zixibacteria bacterium]|nr:ubiquitin-like domain-containing protein [candidate division Zixibacteria bacterium]
MNRLSILGWLLISSAVALAGASAWFWLQKDEYTVYDGDAAVTIQGRYDTVEDVLNATGIQVGPYDLVSPTASTVLESGGEIHVKRARRIEVQTDDGTELFWTHETQLSPFFQENGIVVGPSHDIRVGNSQLGFEDIVSAELADQIFITRFKTIEIDDDGRSQSVRTDVESVGEALAEAGITLLNSDTLEPSAEAWLTPGLIIQITRSDPVIVSVDGQFISQRTNFTRTADILSEAGIALGELDYSIPGPEFVNFPGNIIRIVRVTEEYLLEDEVVPYDSLFQGTDQLELDERAILAAGEPGLLRRRIRIRYEDGVEIGRFADGEWVEKEAVDEVTGFGTRIEIRVLETSEGSYEYWRAVRMRATAYTASSSGKPPEHPAYGITASGVSAGTGVVAVDPKVVPFRSWVYVPGYGIGFAGDTGGGVKGRWIDLGYDEDELVAWNGYADVYYLTPVPPLEDIVYLIPAALP